MDELIKLGKKYPNMETIGFSYYDGWVTILKFCIIPIIIIITILVLSDILFGFSGYGSLDKYDIIDKYKSIIFLINNKKPKENVSDDDVREYDEHYDMIIRLLVEIGILIGLILLLLFLINRYNYVTNKVNELSRSPDDMSLGSAIRVGHKMKSAIRRNQMNQAAYRGARDAQIIWGR